MWWLPRKSGSDTSMSGYRKKLIEVALPLEAISEESSRRKRKAPAGYPTTFHWWYAQRPIAACRAVLFSSLVDDPDSDPAFDSYGPDEREHAVGERRAELFELIEELVKWENSNNTGVINRARAEIAASVASRKIELGELDKDTVVFAPAGPLAKGGKRGVGKKTSGNRKEGDKHPDGPLAEDGTTAYGVMLRQSKPDVVNHFLANHAPPVLDPFAGGGSIPLEAQRLGLRAHASDLNPVAVLINKALIEVPPKFAGMPPVHPDAEKRTGWSGVQGLAEDVRRYGKWMRDEAEKRIGHLYPKVKITEEMAVDRPDLSDYVGQELTVVAWLWARTVKCPNPGCGHRMPMLRSFWLSKKKGKEAYADPVVDARIGTVTFKIRREGSPPDETSNRTMARCLFCGNEIKKPQLRETARDHGIQEVPLAVVAEGTRGRVHLEAQDAALLACEPPDAPEIAQLITDDKRWFSPPQYGLPTFRDLFTPRQLCALVTFSDLVGDARARVLADARATDVFADQPDPNQLLGQGGTGPEAYADAVAIYLATALSRVVDYNSSLATWRSKDNAMRSTIGKQALPMVWDFAEANPLGKSSSAIVEAIGVVAKAMEQLPADSVQPGHAIQRSAVDSAGQGFFACCTDPPYYDNVGYSDLADFFYVWLRRTLRDVSPDLTSTMLSPKSDEIIASSHRHAGDKAAAKAFFEERLSESFQRLREQSHPEVPATIFYAFKQAESSSDGHASTGWETFLAAVLDQGFGITGTWPLRTEGDNRQIGIGANALASSIVLVCRVRPEDAPLATRREFGEALRAELPEAIRRMQFGNVAPVDLAQASIGPGMAVFSRHGKVVNADGTPMTVREALQLINQVLDEALTEQESDFDADTRWALKWFDQYSQKEGPYGDAETLATATAVSVSGLVEAGFLKAGAGKVRLLKREELDPTWDPVTDSRLTIWEVTQYLIHRLEQDGESGAAELLRRVGAGAGETARELAYRLYQTCERKKWADQARSYNGLVVSWPEIQRLSREKRPEPAPAQQELF